MLIALLAACSNTFESPVTKSRTWAETADILRKLSCPTGTEIYDPSPISITASPVELGSKVDLADPLLSDLVFVGGWHLTSDHSDFGGLSGLALLDSGDLLAVSDRGAFITIGMRAGAPDGRGTFMPMLGATGQTLSGKRAGDAEGLALAHGLAWVSFERDHRILAFDLMRCGIAARGVPFAVLPDVVETNGVTVRIGENGGAESLAFDAKGALVAGYETVEDNRAPRLAFGPDGRPDLLSESLNVAPGFKLVGADGKTHLMRAYDRQAGNRNDIVLPEQIVRLAPPLAVDNFEGVAEDARPSVRRLYLISDDNFSNRQRTLLYIFESPLP